MKREFKVSMFIVKYRFGSECAILEGLPVSHHFAYDKKFGCSSVSLSEETLGINFTIRCETKKEMNNR